MLRIIVSCANGAGSSLMMKMKIEQVMKELGVAYQIHHCPISEGKGMAPRYDVVFTALNFVSMFDSVKDKVKIIGIKNIMSADEIKQKYLEAFGEN